MSACRHGDTSWRIQNCIQPAIKCGTRTQGLDCTATAHLFSLALYISKLWMRRQRHSADQTAKWQPNGIWKQFRRETLLSASVHTLDIWDIFCFMNHSPMCYHVQLLPFNTQQSGIASSFILVITTFLTRKENKFSRKQSCASSHATNWKFSSVWWLPSCWDSRTETHKWEKILAKTVSVIPGNEN